MSVVLFTTFGKLNPKSGPVQELKAAETLHVDEGSQDKKLLEKKGEAGLSRAHG